MLIKHICRTKKNVKSLFFSPSTSKCFFDKLITQLQQYVHEHITIGQWIYQTSTPTYGLFYHVDNANFPSVCLYTFLQLHIEFTGSNWFWCKKYPLVPALAPGEGLLGSNSRHKNVLL